MRPERVEDPVARVVFPDLLTPARQTIDASDHASSMRSFQKGLSIMQAYRRAFSGLSGCMKEAFYVDNDGGHVLDDDTYEAGESAITRRDSCLIAPFPRVKMTF